jgi:cytochrome c1
MLKNKVLLLAAFLSGLLFLSMTIDPLTAEAESTAFTVIPSFPENQVSEATYFDLHVNGETKQELSVVLQNTTDQPLEIEAQALNSYTTSTGIISYQKTETAEKNKGRSFTKLIEPKQQRIRVMPNEAKAVSFTLDMKKQNITGEILGAFSFAVIPSETKETDNTMIQARYETQVGVRLRTELTDLPSPNLTLVKTEPIVKNDNAAIQSTVKNDQPVAFGKVKVNITIAEKETKKNVGEKEVENYQIAPNSTIPLVTELNTEQLEPGEYTTHIELTSPKGHWVFDDSFTVSAANAKTINQKTVYAEKYENKNILIYVLIFFILLLLLVILYLGWKYYRSKKIQRK